MALKQPCAVCGIPTHNARCEKHFIRERHTQPRSNRGYDSAYYKHRANLLRACEEIWARGGRVPCSICGKPVTRESFSAEHVKPVRAGGGSAGNLAPAHKSCNYGWRRSRR